MKLIRTEDAVGQVLCHDITQIIPGQFRSTLPQRASSSRRISRVALHCKENLYVWEKRPGILHEDEAHCPFVQGSGRPQHPRH